MNKHFNESEIILGRLPNKKVVPILIIKSNNIYFGLRLYKYNPNYETTFSSTTKNTKKTKQNFKKTKSTPEILIHQSEGLKFTSVVDIKQKVSLNQIEKIKGLCYLEKTKYQLIINNHNEFLRKEYQEYINSHTKKKKKKHDVEIEISAINNEKSNLIGKRRKKFEKWKGPTRSLNYIEPIHTPYITVYRF